MKVKKFGTVTTDGSGNLCIRNFMFYPENAEEAGLDPNDPEVMLPAIANHLLKIVKHGKMELTDFSAERIVSGALRKAKAGGLK
ncbi:hypothetical protein EV102420_06_00260 [Pseudescherichia vulneris NBRC 102420]|uniref:Uncharacterized protein n=1 Tax=Pseudescherichia vulneris NBRC 102420 TaxID=1115515 RepID=A0A090VPX3_PSEVU|nr:hypothetical protein [Pseudescherichia vulneris]GAL57152.1 hypothetical protein EV102420_06_00260 [Pseudescherichia vulneris NBRC 102420]STQ60997.1 Uncharacterised protein [Pseudescherichia vulneris]